MVFMECSASAGRHLWAAAAFGLVVHWRIYPVIYALPILLFLPSRGESSILRTRREATSAVTDLRTLNVPRKRDQEHLPAVAAGEGSAEVSAAFEVSTEGVPACEGSVEGSAACEGSLKGTPASAGSAECAAACQASVRLGDTAVQHCPAPVLRLVADFASRCDVT